MNIFIALITLVAQTTILKSACNPGEFQEVAGSPFAAAINPSSVAFSPLASGNLFAAVTNFNSNNVSVYSVNQTTGTFTPVPGSAFAAGVRARAATFSPVVSGNLFAAVLIGIALTSIVVYSVNQTTGAFTPVPGSPFTAGVLGQDIAFSPLVSGNLFAAVANASSNNVSVYLVNQSTGAFTPVAGSPFATGTAPTSIAFSSLVSGNLFAAVANASSNNVSVYLVNQSTGAFTPVAGSPFAAGNNPNSIDFSPIINGNLFAAVSNGVSDDVSVYLVNQTTGAFTPVAGSPFTTADTPVAVAFSPDASGNLFAAIVNNGSSNDSITMYSVNTSTGAFTQVASSLPGNANPTGVDFSPIVMDNLFAAVSNFSSNNVSVYNVCVPVTPPPTPSMNLQPPSSATACKTRNIFLTQTDFINRLTWTAPTTGDTPSQYQIYRKSLSNLIGVVLADNSLQFLDHNRKKNKNYTYFIVSGDGAGNVSSAITVTADQNC